MIETNKRERTDQGMAKIIQSSCRGRNKMDSGRNHQNLTILYYKKIGKKISLVDVVSMEVHSR